MNVRGQLLAARQRGMAALMTVLFLLVVVGFAVLVALGMSGSDIGDTSNQHNSVAALFLAESGVERAMWRLGQGTACTSVGPDSASLGNGTFNVVSGALSGSNCQIQVKGIVGNVTRTISALASIPSGGATAQTLQWTWSTGNTNKWAYAAVALRPSGSITAGAVGGPVTGAGTSRTLSYTVPAGASILLVGISVDQATTAITMTYGGTAMTSGVTAVGVNPWPKAQIFYLINPPAGTANIVANMSISTEAVMGAMAFSGVTVGTGATTPFDVAPITNSGNSKVASVTITPATSGAWIFDTLSINANDTTTMTAMTNRVSRWNTNSNGNVRGDASTLGPVTSGGTGSPNLLTWTEIVSN